MHMLKSSAKQFLDSNGCGVRRVEAEFINIVDSIDSKFLEF
jgi:hypothetical protein